MYVTRTFGDKFAHGGKFPLGTRGEIPVIRDMDGKVLKTFPLPNESVCCIAAMPDKKCLAFGTDDGSIFVWDPDTDAYNHCTVPGSGSIGSLEVTPDGKIVASYNSSWGGRGSNDLFVWDGVQPARKVTGHTGEINCVAKHPDGRIITGSCDGTIRVWDRSFSGAQVLSVGNIVVQVACLSDGRIVSASDDGYIRVWDLDTETYHHEMKMSGGNIGVSSVSLNNFVILPDNRIVHSKCDQIRILNPQTGECVHWQVKDKFVNFWNSFVCCLPDNRFITSDYDSFRMWDPDTGKCLLRMRSHKVRTAGFVEALGYKVVVGHCSRLTNWEVEVQIFDFAQ